ncbi:hypothetical protein D3C87_2206260 [compost metagenome]
MIHVPQPKLMKPMAIMMRGSSLVDTLPAIGAVKNMARPETNMVSPIISAS